MTSTTGRTKTTSPAERTGGSEVRVATYLRISTERSTSPIRWRPRSTASAPT